MEGNISLEGQKYIELEKKMNGIIDDLFHSHEFSIIKKEFYIECQKYLSERKKQVGLKNFQDDLEHYYKMAMIQTAKSFLTSKEIYDGEVKNLIKREMGVLNRHKFELLEPQFQEALKDAEVSQEDFLAIINNRDYVDKFEALFMAAELDGEFKIFKLEKFPQWKYVRKAFEKKFPIVDVKLGYIFSTSTSGSHQSWKKTLYNYQNRIDSRNQSSHGSNLVSDNLLENKFINSGQGYYRGGGSGKSWQISFELIKIPIIKKQLEDESVYEYPRVTEFKIDFS